MCVPITQVIMMINLVIPMAGEGRRFADVGYLLPKPFIDVAGEQMIRRVVENLTVPGVVITLICRSEHVKYFEHLSKIYDINILALNSKTEGAVCTVLRAEHIINNDAPLIIANSDQLILGLSMTDFLAKAQEYDGYVITFNSTNPHHSYVRLQKGEVVELAEKKVISDNAVAGIYYYKKGGDFVKYAKQMIKKNIRHNNEFYISPVYNELLQDKKRLGIYEVSVNDKHMLGTPEELNIFLDKVESGKVKL
jgi:dTDP-glucose pyrophosphorylase